MAFEFEFRGLLFGLLTATSLAAITGIAQFVIKRLLPRPSNIDRRRRHTDGRDALAELIVSCEGVPALLNGPYVHNSVAGRIKPPPLQTRIRIIFLFLLAFILTIVFETVLILATGSNTSVLTIPDIAPYSFVERHNVKDGYNLPKVVNTTLNKQRCLENTHIAVNESHYYNYEQLACLRTKIKKNATFQTWTLYTEENQADAFKLLLGRVYHINESAIEGKIFEKEVWAQIAIFIHRRVAPNHHLLKRVLDHDSAKVVYEAVHEALPSEAGCSVKDARDETLDRDLLGRPAMLANFSCTRPLSVPEAVAVSEIGAIASIGLYYYDRNPLPEFHVDEDRELLLEEKEFRAGISVSESYEDGWFIALFGVTACGILVFVLDRVWIKRVYPNVAVLTIMSDLSRSNPGIDSSNENDSKPLSSTPALIAHASAIASESTNPGSPNKLALRYGFVNRGDAENISMETIPELRMCECSFQ